MGPSQPKSRAGIPSFEGKLENEEDVLDAILAATAKNQVEAAVWAELHQAAVRDDRVSELAFAYESLAQGKKLRTILPQLQAELFYRAATFFGDVLGDEFGATTYLERALSAFPAHPGAFERIDAQLTRVDDNKRLAELCAQAAPHRPKAEQVVLMQRAAGLYERAGLEDKAIETYQQLVRLAPADEAVRDALEARYLKANRHRDLARMLEQALASDPPPEGGDASRIRAKLIDVFGNQLKEPERALPHVEALLEYDPQHGEARRIAMRLLESKGLAARAASALAGGATSVEERAKYLGIELDNTRGPKRRDVLVRIGLLKQDALGDAQGAFEAFEQAMGIDPGDDELRRRYVQLGSQLKGPLEVARTFARVSTVAKDAGVRSRITAEMGELLLRGGDAKRARTTLAGVLAATNADPQAILVASRALAGVYEAERDTKALLDVLTRVGEGSADPEERQRVNERIAELSAEQGDVERAIGAFRRLVDTSARERALAALEPLYESRSEWIDLSFVLEERAKSMGDRVAARALSFRAASVLTHQAKDVSSAIEAWRQMIEAYGPARDIYVEWIPLLEHSRQWLELATALAGDANLAEGAEKAAALARLGQIHLQRTRDAEAAIDAFRGALAIDREEKSARGTLEKLLVAGDHRLAAATVLEPVFRAENNAQGLLRVLDIRAQTSTDAKTRLAALAEAADVAVSVSRDKAIEVVARGLGEAVTSGEELASWLDRFDRMAHDFDAKRRAGLLAAALGDRAIDSQELLALAKRVGEEYAAAGDVAGALGAFRRALAFDPTSSELIARVDDLLKEDGNPEERVALYRAALERGAEPARRRQLLHSIGSIERYELKNLEAAMLAYKRALKDSADDGVAYVALVELYNETESWDDLSDILEDHLGRGGSPEDQRATLAELAELGATHGDAARAAEHAHALLAHDAIAPDELDLVERVAQKLRDVALQTAALERRVRETTDPRQQVQALERLAKLAHDAGEREKCLARLRQAIDVAHGIGDDTSAAALLSRVRKLDPNDATSATQLLEIYERTERWEKVPDLCIALIGLATESAARLLLQRQLARVLADRLGRFDEAFAAEHEAFAAQPADLEILDELADISIRAGNPKEFALAIGRALAKPEGAAIRTQLLLAKARVLATTQSTWEKAIEAYRTVLEDGVSGAPAEEAVSGLEKLLGAMPKGESHTEHYRWLLEHRALTAPAGDRARWTFAWAQMEENELGDPKRALELYRQVLAIDENDIEALGAVSRLSLAQGDVEGALAALVARRASTEGEARNTLDVQIAGILVDRPGRANEALDRLASVLETSPHDTTALELASRLLKNDLVGVRAAEILERSLDAVEDDELRIDILRKIIERDEPRRELYERLLDLLVARGLEDEAYATAREGAGALPAEGALWDRAEELARKLSAPDPLAALYEVALGGAMPTEAAMELGQRAVAFSEEWFEDKARVIGILQRILEIDPDDAWAFERLKLIFDAEERWDDLFALYDRAVERADRSRKTELLEEAAQIAKDFANHSKRAIDYLEQLLELRPGNARLSSALERLYERHGCHRELIHLLASRIDGLPHDEAQRERMRIAGLWLSQLSDAASALLVVEDIVAHRGASPEDAAIDVTDLLERVLAVAPPTTEMRESLMPAPLASADPAARRDAFVAGAPNKRTLVRQRAAALLKERYSEPGLESDLVRVLEVELEAVRNVKERIRRHQQIAAIYLDLGDDEAAMDHFVQLVLLEPEIREHRSALADIARRVGRFERLADVLVAAADDGNDEALRIELLMEAGVVTAHDLKNVTRAIDLFFRILAITPISDEAALAACRHVEPLLAETGRLAERLDVLERLAILENETDVRQRALAEAAMLATELGEDDRAIWAWEGILEISADDPDALDGLAHLLAKAERWSPLIDVLNRRARLDLPDALRRSDRVRVAQIQAERLGEPSLAIDTWRDVEGAFGESEEGTRALAELYRTTESWSELADLLGRAATRAETDGEKSTLLRDLADVQREELGDPRSAIESYESSLKHDPQLEGSRAGLRVLLGQQEHRADVVRVLLAAYVAADDWRLVLELTEHRLDAATTPREKIAILSEAARLSELRASDQGAAFALVRRAHLFDPSDENVVSELFRLAEATRNHRSLADAMREAVDGVDGNAPWVRALRFRMGEILETRLDEPRVALEAYVQVAQAEPSAIEPARAVIRVAGKTARADAAARAFVEATRARGDLSLELVTAIEDAATQSSGWDAITFAIASLVHDGGELPPTLARDIEAQIAVWHRDRRGDPDAAESAYARALAHDSQNAAILGELAQLQRRAKGRPLVDSLLRLSQTTGGDLDLLSEAADVAVTSLGDRALAKSIFERLLKLAAERWLGAKEDDVSSGSPTTADSYVERAVRELARIHGEDGDHEKVVQLLTDAALLPWSKDKARALRHEAARVAIDRLGAVDRAIGIYLGLVEEDPQDEAAVARLVGLYESGGRKGELLDLKRRLVGSAASMAQRLGLRRESARLEEAMGETTRALATLEENLGEEPRDPSTVSALADLLRRESKLRELEALLSRQAELAEAASERETAADFHARAARVAEEEPRDLPRAIRHLERVVDLDVRPAALDSLARLSTATGTHAAAADYLARLRELAESGQRADVTLRLADALLRAGRPDEARERLEEDVHRDPEADRVRVRLADVYRKGEDYRALAELLEGGAVHAPDKAMRLARLREAAELHRSRTGEPERAIPLLEQAADLSPEDNGIRLALADVLGAAGRFDDARTLLRGLIDVFGGRRPKERAPVHYHLARLDLAVGDRARALVELDAAMRIDPANPEILHTLAELARDDGQLERAERSYRALITVLRRLPEVTDDVPVTRSEVLFELSQIALRQGDGERSKEILESAFELSQESLVEARRLEAALRKRGDFVNLARALESRVTRGGDDGSVYAELGQLYQQHLGRAEEAYEMLARALEADPTSDAVHEATMRLAADLGRSAELETRLRAIAEAEAGELAATLWLRVGALAEGREGASAARDAALAFEKASDLRPRDRDVLAALDRIYERLADDAGQARVLGARVALDVEEGGASSDALYRLAQLRFRSRDVDAAVDALEQAFEADPDANRAEELLRGAADAHPTNERIIDLYERLARAPERERSLVDALVRRFALPGSSSDPMREAVEIAEKIEDKELATSLLRKYLEADHDDNEGRVWALSALAWRNEEEGRIREAVLLKREAAEIAEPTEARRLLFEVAGLAAGPLEDLKLAASIYEELHEREPEDRDAWELLLDLYRRTDAYTKFVELVGEIAGYVDDPHERAKLRLERVRVGTSKLRLSDDDAASELRDIVDDDPTLVDAAILLASILERTGREDDLAELLSKQLDAAKDRQDADAIGSLSRRLGQLLEGRDRGQARDVYYAALEWDPTSREVLSALERLHAEAGETAEQADVMEKRLAIERGDDAETLALALAELRTRQDDQAAAVRALEVGFKAAPTSARVRTRLEAIYRAELEYERLAGLFEADARARKDPAERAARLREAAKIYRDDIADPERGARALREAREAAPGDLGLLDDLVDMLVASGELAAAITELASAIDGLEPESPERPNLIARRAILRGRVSDMEGALADFEEAIARGVGILVPFADHLGKMAMQAAGRNEVGEWRRHRLRIAELRVATGEIEEARNVLTELLKTDSKDKATLRAIAHVDELEGRWDSASATYRRLVGLEDASGIAFAAMKLAETCEKAGRLADARGGLERARLAVPGDPELRERLAWLYEQLGALKELAELVLEEARATGDVGPRFDGLLRAGQILLTIMNDPTAVAQVGAAAAVAPLEEAHALRPADLDCAALLSDAYVASGRLDEARDLLGRTIASFKGRRARELSPLHHRLARVAEFVGDKPTELVHLTTALDMDAQNGAVASELAEVAMDQGNWDLANRALRQITMLKTPSPMPKALAYQHLGTIARQQGDSKRAMMLLKRAIDEDPSLDSARAYLEQIQAEG